MASRESGTTVVAALLALALALGGGCGVDKPMSGPGDARGDATGGGQDGAPGRDRAPDAAGALNLAPVPVPEGGRDGGPGAVVPARDGAASDRGARVPRPPPGAVPPCAPDAMAVHGQACPYSVLVACTPSADARTKYICYCFAPPSSGKWFCQEGGDGVTTGSR